MKRLVEHGMITNEESFRLLRDRGDPPIWELKVHDPAHRLYLVQTGADWYATHGSPKRQDRKLKTEIERARTIYMGRST